VSAPHSKLEGISGLGAGISGTLGKVSVGVAMTVGTFGGFTLLGKVAVGVFGRLT